MANQPADQSCSNCYFWRGPKTATDVNGYCCAHPPKRLEPDETGPHSVFPTTTPNTWCGEYKESKEPAPLAPPVEPEPRLVIDKQAPASELPATIATNPSEKPVPISDKKLRKK